MRALVIALSFFVVFVFVAPRLGAQQPAGTELVHAVEALGYADGSFSYRYLTYDPQTGQFAPAVSEDRPARASQMLPPNFRFQPALVQQSARWGSSAPKPWSWAEQAPVNSRLLMKNLPRVRATKNLMFVRRGNVNMPRFTQSNQKIPVRNIPNPIQDLQQFDFDKRSTVVRTADNKFFRGQRPDVTSRVIRFESANCTLGGGVFRCPFLINECDIYLRSRTLTELGFFEDTTVLRQRIALASHTTSSATGTTRTCGDTTCRGT